MRPARKQRPTIDLFDGCMVMLAAAYLVYEFVIRHRA